jgi:hypothetical protein
MAGSSRSSTMTDFEDDLLTEIDREPRRKDRPRCGAKTRVGGSCLVRAEPGKARCRFHGGLSTGPKTELGRARIAEAQRRRWRAYRENRLKRAV